MRLDIDIPYNYKPRTYQNEVFKAYKRGIRRFVLVWHRRSGKDKTMLNFMIARMMERVGMYWYVLPFYEQARLIIWEGMGSGVNEGMPFIEHFPEELIAFKNEQRLEIGLINGSIFRLVGSDHVDRLVGANPIGVVYSEYSLQFPNAWELISPILTENKGWAAFIFTPRGRNHAYKLFEKALPLKTWFVSTHTIDETVRDSRTELEDTGWEFDERGKVTTVGDTPGPVVTLDFLEEERARGMEEDLIQQEYYCSFVGYREGSYYGRMLADAYNANRVAAIPWDPRYPVCTGWDLGVADQCAIWFGQVIGKEIRLIDYYQNNSQGLVHYIKVVRDKPYVYSNHYGPHDLRTREITSGKARYEVAAELGIYFRIVPKLAVQEGIDYARTKLPMCWFDKDRCDMGIRALINYHKDFNQKTLNYKFHPVHDVWSHGADAYRYFCLGIDNEGEQNRIPPMYQKDFNIFDEVNQIGQPTVVSSQLLGANPTGVADREYNIFDSYQ